MVARVDRPLSWDNPGDVEFGWPGAAGSGWSEPRCAAASVAALTSTPGCHPGQPNPSGACAADHNKSTPCCGQKSDPGTTVPPAQQCPASKPTCVGYVYDHHYGHCTGTGPTPPPPPGSNSTGARIVMQQPCFWNLVHRPFQPIQTIPRTYSTRASTRLALPVPCLTLV